MKFTRHIPEKIKKNIKSAISKSRYLKHQLEQYLFRDYSQKSETQGVRKTLKNYPSKFFVEIGSNDGITYSTTYGLLLDGWSGWSIEANPITYKSLVVNLNKFDKVKTFNIAIAPKQGKVKLWLGKNDPQGLLATISEEEGDWYKAHRSSEYIEVDSMPLSQFLARQNTPTHFGLLMIDAEGMDLEILHTLDPAQHRPKLIITEDYEPKNAEKFSLLKSYGYTFLKKIGCNTFWIAQE